MTDWAKAMNPSSPITNEAEAVGAARASAIAIFLGVLWGGVGVVQMFTQQAQMTAAAAASAADPAAADVAGAMIQGAMYFAVGIVVVQLILGIVQWAKPNIVIPIIFLILVIGGGLLAVAGLVMASSMAAAAETPQAPLWQTVIGFVILAIQAVLHICGIRGARKLDKFRFDAANNFS